MSSSGVAIGVGDDGAVLEPRRGTDQVQVIDTLVEGVHFPAESHAADIGYRVVAVNLSDIAAMGARPRWMTLALTMPAKNSTWLAAFADGLFEAGDEFGVVLVGGDTTRGERVVATVHISGEVQHGTALLRSGARPGDVIYVSGTLGDGAAGLALLQRQQHDDYLVGRFLRPRARIDTGISLIGRASAAIDVSDGLLGDLRKLLKASDVGGELHIERLPISTSTRRHFDAEQCLQFALHGGDDYELCITARPELVENIAGLTAIGEVTADKRLVCRRDGVIEEHDDSGYRHFA